MDTKVKEHPMLTVERLRGWLKRLFAPSVTITHHVSYSAASPEQRKAFDEAFAHLDKAFKALDKGFRHD